MTKTAKKKDSDPAGIKASMDLINEIANLNDQQMGWAPYKFLYKFNRQARKIRRKFTKEKKS